MSEELGVDQEIAGSEQGDGDTVQDRADTDTVSSNEEDPLVLDQLLEESGLSENMASLCGELVTEYTYAYLEGSSEQPYLIAFCHPGTNASLEGQTGYVQAAYQADGQWVVDLLAEQMMGHVNEELGTVLDEQDKEVLVFKKLEAAASYGRANFAYVFFNDSTGKPELGVQAGLETVHPDLLIEENQVVFEDDQMREVFSFTNGAFSSDAGSTDNGSEADVVIEYFNDGDGIRVDDEFLNGIDVEPGDLIAFRRKEEANTIKFLIETDMKPVEGSTDTYEVGLSDIGKTVFLHEISYSILPLIIGKDEAAPDVLSSEFFNQLINGTMPGSPVQLYRRKDEIGDLVNGPLEESTYQGAMSLIYKDYMYQVPIMDEMGDFIYTIIKTVDTLSITGADLKTSWGEPDEIIIDDQMSNTLYWIYQGKNDYQVTVIFSDLQESSPITGIELSNPTYQN
ncbi:hypothetical protein [Jeotgalibacillus malaysiensis]|uniref:hypothetical protein n=1 Tax=Jeotgalibacillus malaysiensis TaxID=1508404 RepID=UPI00384F1EE1